MRTCVHDKYTPHIAPATVRQCVSRCIGYGSIWNCGQDSGIRGSPCDRSARVKRSLWNEVGSRKLFIDQMERVDRVVGENERGVHG